MSKCEICGKVWSTYGKGYQNICKKCSEHKSIDKVYSIKDEDLIDVLKNFNEEELNIILRYNNLIEEKLRK